MLGWNWMNLTLIRKERDLKLRNLISAESNLQVRKIRQILVYTSIEWMHGLDLYNRPRGAETPRTQLPPFPR